MVECAMLSEDVCLKADGDRTEEEQYNYTEALKIYDYHKNINIVEEVPKERFQETYSQSTRSLIIKILSKGIKDIRPDPDDPKNLIETTRYALSGAEIVDQANKFINDTEMPKYEQIDKVTKSNVFFHLKKLEEGGFVKEAGVIKSGRRRTTYYGKGAKVFVESDSGDYDYYPLLSEKDFKEFLKENNPEVDESHIEDVLSNLQILNRSLSHYFVEWLQENEENFRPYMINFVNLHAIFTLIPRFKPETVDALQELSNLLHIDQDKLLKEMEN